MNSLRTYITLTLGLTVAVAALAQAGQGGAGDGAARLLEVAEKYTPAAVAGARAQYEALKTEHPGDARIDYVYGIALINQRRYGEAVSLLDRYLAHHADEAHALQAKIWAELQDRRYASAIKSAVRLSQHFPANQQPQPAPELEETARFLGIVFGYLDLARRDVVKEELRQAGKNRILAALGNTYLPAFDQGRQTVADRLADLQGEQEQKQQRAAEKLVQRQDQAEAALSDDRTKIAFSRQTIDASAEQLQDAGRQLSVLSTQLTSLQKDRIRLTAQMTYVQTLLQNSSSNLASVSPAAPIGASIDTIARLTNLSVTFSALNRQAIQMDKRIHDLQLQAAQLNAAGTQQLQTVAANQSAAQDMERRAKALERQVHRLESRPPKNSRLTAEMTRLSTYLPFPFDEEKERILGWLKN